MPRQQIPTLMQPSRFAVLPLDDEQDGTFWENVRQKLKHPHYKTKKEKKCEMRAARRRRARLIRKQEEEKRKNMEAGISPSEERMMMINQNIINVLRAKVASNMAEAAAEKERRYGKKKKQKNQKKDGAHGSTSSGNGGANSSKKPGEKKKTRKRISRRSMASSAPKPPRKLTKKQKMRSRRRALMKQERIRLAKLKEKQVALKLFWQNLYLMMINFLIRSAQSVVGFIMHLQQEETILKIKRIMTVVFIMYAMCLFMMSFIIFAGMIIYYDFKDWQESMENEGVVIDLLFFTRRIEMREDYD